MKKWFQINLTIQLLLPLFASPSFCQTEVSTRLNNYISNIDRDYLVPVLIVLRDQADIHSLDEQLYRERAPLNIRAFTIITALKEKARSTQQDLTAYLSSQSRTNRITSRKSFWVVNMIRITAKPEVINELTKRTDIAEIDLDAEPGWDRPVSAGTTVPEAEGKASEGKASEGLKIINADKLWKLGITGAGRLVMNMDTGVDGMHPALAYKWRGRHAPASQAWFDPYENSTAPNDGEQHGTHTMGIMCGMESSTGDTTGVAFDAEWIAAKTIMGTSITSGNILALQWAMDPDNDPTTINDIPDVICCSWYDPNATDECSGIYKLTLDAVEAAGIAVVFSAGNQGPSSYTITKPKNINTNEVNTMSVAAIDGSKYMSGDMSPIAAFSSRGPSLCGGSGALLIKPEVSAPGVSVRSTVPGGGYAGGSAWSGTSMACAHVAGAVALLKQFAPGLTGRQIKTALYNTAKDLGTPGEDNIYGRGLIDVYAAFLSLGKPDSVPPASVCDLKAINPTSNSLDIVWTTPSDSSYGGVREYDIRYSGQPLNENNFSSSGVIRFNGVPEAAGSSASAKLEGLHFKSQYYFAVKSRDIWGNVSSISNIAAGTTYGVPLCSAEPESLTAGLNPDGLFKDTITISNISPHKSTLDYSVSLRNSIISDAGYSVNILSSGPAKSKHPGTKEQPIEESGGSLKGNGGPDKFGYKWIDSDASDGPLFVWNDISITGTEITNWTAADIFNSLDEGKAGPLQLGFSFSYYGRLFSHIWISTNGFISINDIASGAVFINTPLPRAAVPNGIIAAFWDDLDGSKSGGGGKVYYKQEKDRFIIQYTNWPLFSTAVPGVLTFQIVLYRSGKIMCYYKSVSGSTASATAGIENPEGTDGLQVVYNASYIKNNLAVKYEADPDWLIVPPVRGRLYNGSSADLEITFRPEGLPEGQYKMDLEIASNDPEHQVLIIPVKMNIAPVPVELTSFGAVQQNNEIVLSWSTASEKNNACFRIERKYGGKEWQEIFSINGKGSTSETSIYSYKDRITEAGSYSYRLKQMDYDGEANFSRIVEIKAIPPWKFKLQQNNPNPFNLSTEIKYSIPEKSFVSLRIYSITGELVKVLINGNMGPGYHSAEFNAAGLPSGIYICRMTAAGIQLSFTGSIKILLIK